MEESLNRKYREYKNLELSKVLSFKEWVARENEKGESSHIGFDGAPSDTLQAEILALHQSSGLKTGIENNYVLGIDKKYIAAGVIVLVAVGTFLIYKTFKNRS